MQNLLVALGIFGLILSFDHRIFHVHMKEFYYQYYYVSVANIFTEHIHQVSTSDVNY